MLGNISTVTTTDLITAAKFNEIQGQVYQIVGPSFYNYRGYVSHPVTTATVITITNWGNLHQDLSQCIIHQTNSTMSVGSPQQGTPVTAAFVNTLVAYANIAYANSATVAVAQSSNSSFNSTSTRLAIWNAPLEHRVQYTWYTSGDAEGFFALGGYIRPHVDSAGGTSTADDIIWRNLIVAADANLLTAPYQFNITDWNSLASGASKTVIAGSYLNESLQVVYTKDNYQQLTVKVKFITDQLRTMDLNVFSTVYQYYSLGGVGPAPHGFPARRPDVITTLDLNGAQGFNEFAPRRIIGLSPVSMTFSGYTSSTIATQALSIANIGNTATTITGLTQISDSGQLTLVDPGVTFPLTINSGTTAVLNIGYSGNIPGTFQNGISIDGNMDAGASTLDTSITLALKPFDFTLSPSSVSDTLTVGKLYETAIAIQPINGIYGNYTASIGGDAGFSLKTPKSLTGPIVIFDPHNRPQGTYATTVTVTVNGVTHTATVTHNNQIQQSSNLGSWVSALGNFNGVVGMSYDIIDGSRFLTIGLGMGDNNSTTLDVGGSSFVNTSYLNYNGDANYRSFNDPTHQMVMSKTPLKTAWGPFLNQYGVWPSSDNTIPVQNGAMMVRSWTFTVPTSKTYRYQFSCDDYGYFAIDGQAINSQQGPNAYYTNSTVNVNIDAGTHTVTLYFNNAGTASSTNQGGIALRIYDPVTNRTYWDTLQTVSTDAYRYWQEVYRIPIAADGTARTLYNRDYCVKDVGAVKGDRWSGFFGEPTDASSSSMFSIADDGQGNLTITTMASTSRTQTNNYDTSLVNFYYNSYYYVGTNVIGRYSQLEDPINTSDTHQFTGFDRNGGVTTIVTTYPGYNNVVPGGGGSSDNWIPGAVLGGGVGAALVEGGILVLVGTAEAAGIGAAIGAVLLKIICTELHKQGKLPDDIFEADQKFGQALLEQNPDAYYGYRAWAEVVVDWMQGGGPDMLFWIKDPVERQQKITAFVNNWTEIIAIPWAEHMAYRMGVREQDNKIGKLLMYAGIPISIAVGKWQRWSGKSDKPAGWFKGAAIIGICAVLRTVVAVGNLLGKK